MWATDGTAPPIFTSAMSKKRFHQLLQALRFDDSTTRVERKLKDNLAPIRDLFEQFVDKCRNNFSLCELTKIDEMLDAFRGRCKFCQYIPNKPAKYGIKMYALVDAIHFYTANIEIYAGKQPEGPFKPPNDATSVVIRLLKPIDRSGRNVTMDNYFTSIPLANDLYVNHRLKMVGTIRKNKRELPLQFSDPYKDRKVHSSMFGYCRDNNYTNILFQKK